MEWKEANKPLFCFVKICFILKVKEKRKILDERINKKYIGHTKEKILFMLMKRYLGRQFDYLLDLFIVEYVLDICSERTQGLADQI